MNFGHISIFVAFFSSLGATIHFFLKGKKSNSLPTEPLKSKWRNLLSLRLYYLSFAAGLVASVMLYYAIMTHQFQYTYVAQYSSSNLSVFYLISSFWAGQEGTFLLWAIMASIMGLVFIKNLKNEDGIAMSVVSSFIAFLYLLLLAKSPFEIIVPAPHDGNGLNPLLQDPWMVIHPPILFMGYAATAFPFALVVSALVRKNYNNWFRLGLPWTLFASLALGSGIMIGGFWAYEVLGWGGYWGWDPVENSSLVPWLMLLALIHGLLIHKAKGSLQRTNILFAVLSFILVVYATFLTRSGILANFSVHSFSDLGISNYLIGIMVASVAIGIGLFAVRFNEIKSPKIDHSTLNREVLLFISMYVLVLAALFTFVGMSSPIITGILGKAAQVDTSFYNKVNLPVGIAIAILLGITPFTSWTEEKKGGFLKRFSMPLLLTALACMIAFVAGVTSIMMMLFIASASFGLVTNAVLTFRQYRSGWLHIGGPISHIGVALLFIGIVGSGTFDESKQVILQQDIPQEVYGYHFTFKGVIDPDALKPSMSIEVSDGKNPFVATPKLYFSDYNKAIMREPDIKVMPLKDLYISPLELQMSEENQSHNPMFEIAKGETKELMGYKITFTKFDVGQHEGMGAMSVGAVLNVEVDGKTQEITPLLSFDEKGQRQPVPIQLPAIPNMPHQPLIALTGLSVEQKKIQLEFIGFGQHQETPPTQSLVVDISLKPLMMVVWTGVALMVAGTIIGWRRRTLQKSE